MSRADSTLRGRTAYCGIIGGFSANRIAEELLAGAKDILSAALAMARIPYPAWVKWIWKMVLVLLLIGLLLLLPTVLMPVAGF